MDEFSEQLLKRMEEFFLAGLVVNSLTKTLGFSNQSSKQVAVTINPDRDGFVIENDSSGNLYILADDKTCSPGRKTLTIGPGEMYEAGPVLRRYTGVITYYGEDTTGTATITEFTRSTR